jgi:CRISPR-associated RAMP protein (TIGR02581 family)
MEPIGTDLPVIKDVQDHPFIPGSSLKGVLRSHIESFVRAANPGPKAACIPVGPEDGWCLSRIDGLSDQDIYDQTCLVCQAFGSPWLASKIQVRDALLASLWFGQYQIRDGVAINRDTQTVEGSMKYDYEVVPSQTRFSFSLIGDNLTDAQIGMLCVGLRPFERREISIGGFRSRGLGVVELRWQERKLFDMTDGNIERLFRFLDGDQDPEVWNPLSDEDIRQKYLPAFRELLASLPRDGGKSQHAQAASE